MIAAPGRRAEQWVALATVVSLIALGLGGCGSDGVSGPTQGALVVSAPTSGDAIDADGYMMTVDAVSTLPLAVDGADTLDLGPGSHAVTLAGVANNCTLDGATTRSAEVAAGDTATIVFQVTCAGPRPPRPGPAE